VIFVIVVGLYLVYLPRLSRKTEEERHRKFPFQLRALVIMLYVLMALVIKTMVSEYFGAASSQAQRESALTITTENGLGFQAWQISHPFAVPLLILLLLVASVIGLAMLFRWTNKEKSNDMRNFLIFLCVATVAIIGALIFSFFRL
jgi:hypothetical protein